MGDMSRVRKTSLRVAAYGDVDELNSVIGIARQQAMPSGSDAWLARVQNDLFDLGADLCVPEGGEGDRLRVTAEQVAQLERWCDAVNEALQPLTSFVLPGGSERSVVALGDAETINVQAVEYLNRLSDLLFILARGANAAAGGDVLWVPGGPPA